MIDPPRLPCRRRLSIRPALAAAGLAAVLSGPGLAPPAAAGEVTVQRLDAPVTELRQDGPAVFARAGGWRRLVPCAPGPVCPGPGTPAPRRETAEDGIPHGWVARGMGVRAWYTRPTTRYGHGVLGDRIEGGALAVVADGRRHDLDLPERFVFEDLAPRLADLDGDGRPEIVTIRSDVRRGAALVVYGLGRDGLFEHAAIAPIGRSSRWLNVAGIADYDGDGRRDIAIVKTPHIGGRLEIWTLVGDRLVLRGAAEGFSNHAIGSTELGLSATADADGDGVVDLAVPDARRRSLRIVTLAGGSLRDLARIGLPAPVDTAVGALTGPDGPVFVAGGADGTLMVAAPR